MRRVASICAVTALGLGGPWCASRPSDDKVHAHSCVGWEGWEGGRSPAPTSHSCPLGKGGLPQFTEGHLCLSTSSGRRSFKVAAKGEESLETLVFGEGVEGRGRLGLRPRFGDPGMSLQCFCLF